MTGTGFSEGRIQSFGSIIVNGIKFETDNAVLTRDNTVVSSQQAFNVGEVVSIKGKISADGKTGVASSVNFYALLEGPVLTKPSPTATSTEILGQTVHINDLTILEGFKLKHLEPSDSIKVSGFYDANGDIQATNIKRSSVNSSALRLKGFISNLDNTKETFTINNILVHFSDSKILTKNKQLVDGQFIEIVSSGMRDKTFFPDTISPVNIVTLSPNTHFKIEGLITRFTSIHDFDVNNSNIKITPETTFKDGIASMLGLNVLVQVEGNVDKDGALIADSIAVEHVEKLDKLEANIDAIDHKNKTLVVFGKTIKSNISTILFDESKQKTNPLVFEQILQGEYMDAKVRILDDGSILALSLSREDQEDDISFKGIIDDVDKSDSSFTLFGIRMFGDENTRYFDQNNQAIDATTFFASVQNKVTLVEAEGNATEDNSVLLHSAFLDTRP